MATTFDVIYLGTAGSIDPTEGNTTSENASNIVGSTYGSLGDPLYSHVETFSPGSYSGGDSATYDTNNNASNDTFRINGGSLQTFDAVAIYNATITYTDGTTATISAVVFQDTGGNLYLAPETTYNSDQAALEAKPIRSLTLDSVNNNNVNLTASRYDSNFAQETIVDGTSGNDSMGLGYTDGDGDQITTGDESIDAGDGADTIDASGGNDTVYGGAGDDQITGGSGNDALAGGAGEDTFYFSDYWGSDTVFGDEWDGSSSGANNDVLDFSAVTFNTTIVFTSPEDGTATQSSNTVVFDNIEGIIGSQGVDTIDASVNESGLYLDGFAGPDSIIGGSGDDTIQGGSGWDTINAGAGADSIVGGAGGDSIQGGAGDDTIQGGSGDDTIYGDAPGGATNQIANGTFDSGTSGWTTTGNIQWQSGSVSLFQDSGSGTLSYDTSLTNLNSGESVNGTGQLQFDFFWNNGSPDVSGTTYVHVQINGVTYATIQTGGLNGSSASVSYLNGASGSNPSVSVSAWETITIDLPEGISSTGTLTFTVDAASEGARDDVWIDNVEVLTVDPGNDSIDGETGADIISAGGGDDTIALTDGFGNDTITGGEAGETSGDVIDLSGMTSPVTVTFTGFEAGTITDGTDTASFSEIENLILTDYADSVDATALGSSSPINILAGGGDDTILGGAGNDTVDGGGGADSISGGGGDDSIDGGAGDDTITGGAGNDSLTGGADRDTYVFDDGFGADTISDFDTTLQPDGFMADQLNLSAVLNDQGQPLTMDDVLVSDAGGGNTLLTFPNGETILLQGVAFSELDTYGEKYSAGIPCFVAGTEITTAAGQRPVEAIGPGDLVLTRDHGYQPVLWAGATTVHASGAFAPVVFAPGTVKNRRPLSVSREHRMLLCDWRADILYGAVEVLVPAHSLIDGRTVTCCDGGFVTYVHLLFSDHELIEAEGCWSESFQPNAAIMDRMSAAARAELLALFPALARLRAGEGWPLARPCLRQIEARLVTRRWAA